MDWRKGYLAKYYLSFVDPNSWGDTGRFEVIDGSIKNESSGLRCSADLTCNMYKETTEKLIRIWMDVDQSDSGGHIALFTGYACSPDRKIEGSIEKNSLQCYSVLLPANDVLLPRGWYAAIGANCTTLIKSLLKPTKAKIQTHGKIQDAKLSKSILAESGETNLSMVELILSVQNWKMWVDGLGIIHVSDIKEEAIESFDSMSNDIVEPSLTVTYDWFDCPNVFRAFLDDQTAVAYDYNSETPMSIQNRGREVWQEEDSVALNSGETLQEYADRRLEELQRVATNISYTRRFIPNIYPMDVIRLNYPVQNLTGLFVVTSQTITLGYSAKTSEEVIKL